MAREIPGPGTFAEDTDGLTPGPTAADIAEQGVIDAIDEAGARAAAAVYLSA